MTIRREDLVAAAALGLLQYRQIDPLLVFLLQRDVHKKRLALAASAHALRSGRAHMMLPWTVIGLALMTAALLATLFTTSAVQSMGVGALFFITLFYALGGVGVSAWFKRYGLGGRTRASLTVLFTAAPLAVFALQQV
ncbi:hypothetical protein [Noviherbaspirillum saxi]|uniref:hypothetical protein n=1 Tax=Noviherbaspirillum saxi TaxID=2320863 RepID=UPI001314B368|nr:hypothetical protein [Noviherbaspirillum saxi]